MRLLYVNALAIATLVFAASGCSGANRSLPPVVNALSGTTIDEAAGASGVPKGYGILHLRIPVPGRRHSSARHRVLPAYVSSATAKVAVTIQSANQPTGPTKTFPCAAVCIGNIVAPLGVDAVTLKLEDKKNRVLSRGTSTVVVSKNGNVFDFTLDGVPASVALVPESNVLPVVPASTGYVNFDARDADGGIITPDGHYVDANGNPLVFDLKSSSKSFRLAVRTVSAPGMPIPFSYNGKQHVGKISLTPSARKDVKTSVSLKTGTITLVPGIAKRIAPPLSVLVLSATQVPLTSSAFLDKNATFVLGNSGGQSAALAFDVTTGSYGIAVAESTGAPFQSAPIDQGQGFFGYLEFGNSLWFEEYLTTGGATVSSIGAANPCSGGTPIGNDASGTLFCQEFGIFSGGSVYDSTHSATVANGQDRKIETINGIDYFVTVNPTAASTPGLTVYAAGSTTPVAGATSVGANVTDTSLGYYGDADGHVTTLGNATVAKFSHTVQSVLGVGSSIYVYESNGSFGVFNSSGTFETRRLPISNVVEVIAGVKGAPMLVETDGTLDVMGI